MFLYNVRPGTDTRFPSYRIVVKDYWPDGADQRDLQLAMVFSKGETVAQQQQYIEEYVREYVRENLNSTFPISLANDQVLGSRQI